ncbi:hypothetical protein DERF_005573 [Dermatophagoides farinae]|uniref:Uncharacterized protein n=1 Tax=Dermatophagoides farinae TaxID=6954 RepID=A0A922L6B6_DERFA|nr:hypothetical protein DERF_005573 [Dermatophagoides farinae]
MYAHGHIKIIIFAAIFFVIHCPSSVYYWTNNIITIEQTSSSTSTKPSPPLLSSTSLWSLLKKSLIKKNSRSNTDLMTNPAIIDQYQHQQLKLLLLSQYKTNQPIAQPRPNKRNLLYYQLLEQNLHSNYNYHNQKQQQESLNNNNHIKNSKSTQSLINNDHHVILSLGNSSRKQHQQHYNENDNDDDKSSQNDDDINILSKKLLILPPLSSSSESRIDIKNNVSNLSLSLPLSNADTSHSRIKRHVNHHYPNHHHQQQQYPPTIQQSTSDISSSSSSEDFKIMIENRTDIFDHLEMESKIFRLHNRCSNGDISYNNHTNMNVMSKWNIDRAIFDTHLTFIPSKYNGFGIWWPRQQKFLCINPSTGLIIPKDCFDWCLCSFNEIVAGDHLMYALAVKPDWKLAFNKGGQPLVMMNKMQKKYLKCRHFTKIEIDDNDFGNDHGHHHHHHHHNNQHHYHHHQQQIFDGKTGHNKLKHAEDGICDDWQKLGEQIFDQEIYRDPRLNCILTHHPQFSRLDSKKLQRQLKRRKLNINQTDHNDNNNNATELVISKSNRCFNVSTILFNNYNNNDNSYQSNRRQQRNVSNGGSTITSKKIRRLPKKVRHLCG